MKHVAVFQETLGTDIRILHPTHVSQNIIFCGHLKM